MHAVTIKTLTFGDQYFVPIRFATAQIHEVVRHLIIYDLLAELLQKAV